jgi:hypothetical protein
MLLKQRKICSEMLAPAVTRESHSADTAVSSAATVARTIVINSVSSVPRLC